MRQSGNWDLDWNLAILWILWKYMMSFVWHWTNKSETCQIDLRDLAIILASSYHNLPIVVSFGLWDAAQHPQHLDSDVGHHPAVDREVGGGVHGEEDVRHTAQGDAPHRQPAQVCVATSAKETIYSTYRVATDKSEIMYDSTVTSIWLLVTF